ncbi:uncharacterized protein METZ01_LOCUS173158, partial [marine metagenome]
MPIELIAITRLANSDLPSLNNGKWIEMDIEHPPHQVFSYLGKPDVLLHLAWQGLPNYNSLHHLQSELPIQYNFLNNLICQGLTSIVVTGTCFEYGMQSGCLSEDLETKPSNPYAIAKDSLRQRLEILKKQYDFNLTWARLFYIYGDGQSEESIYSQLKTSIQNSEKKFNMSEGEQLRDFLPIEKVSQHLINLVILNKNIGIVNVCSGKPISVQKLVKSWLEENNWSIELNLGYYPYPNYEPMDFWG